MPTRSRPRAVQAGPDGERIACGITNYDSSDVLRIKGARSTDVQAALGYFYGAEVVHRNNMTLL